MVDGLATLNVLVIDDNPQMRTIVGTVLAAAGVRKLHYAQDGRQALDVLASVPIDLAYVDYEMPKMNGLDFILEVRKRQGQERYLPLIMLTGYAEPSRVAAARDVGVTEFLCKPVSANAILNRLESVIINQRPFVDVAGYFGPCRRRTKDKTYAGKRRRLADAAVI